MITFKQFLENTEDKPKFIVNTYINSEWKTPQFIFKTPEGKEIGELQIKRSLLRGEHDFVVANLLVWKEFQRKGYATLFYKHAVNWIKENEPKGNLFISQDRTKDAQKLHDFFRSKNWINEDGKISFD
jgi:GNAT superfamily N-acetyltransferase